MRGLALPLSLFSLVLIGCATTNSAQISPKSAPGSHVVSADGNETSTDSLVQSDGSEIDLPGPADLIEPSGLVPLIVESKVDSLELGAAGSGPADFAGSNSKLVFDQQSGKPAEASYFGVNTARSSHRNSRVFSDHFSTRRDDDSEVVPVQSTGHSSEQDVGDVGQGSDYDAAVRGGLAANAVSDKPPEAESRWYSIHAQTTFIQQQHNAFPAPYTGAESLVSKEPAAASETGTLYLAARVTESTELVFNPEVIGGRGFSNVFGVAAFPNGEMNRVTSLEPTPYIARLFGRHIWELGGAREEIPDGFNRVAGSRDINRVTVTAGKFAPTDIFDDNRYAHDPRTQFFNWASMYNGAWDYPADVRGYSYGGSIDLNRENWAIRYGIFAEPAVANQLPLDPNFLQAHGQVIEIEERYRLYERPGKLRLMAFLNRAHMGRYQSAVAEMPVNPDITQTRDYRTKYGFGANLEHELTDELGLFARLGWNDGQTESWAFTEIDSVGTVGLVLKGTRWNRSQDQVGTTLVISGISSSHQAYLAAGGLGLQLGDGRLNYAPEEVFETYYRWEIRPGIQISAAFQEINNPGFNRDRGPVSVGSLRVHLEI